MKSEERHRLQETELVKWGRSAREFWEGFLKDSGKIIVIGLGVVCLVAGIVLWWLSSSTAAQAERWKEVISASFDSDSSKSIELFSQTANKYANHPAGEWAALMEAERALSRGILYSRTNRKASAAELVQAREAYAKLTDTKSELIQERRLFGMARCLETLAGVDVSEEDGENVEGVDEAVAAYEQFLERHPDSIFASFAEDRVAALKTGRTQDFYAWYREQNPNPDDLKTPEDGLPPGHPPIGSTSPVFPPRVTEEEFMEELESMVKGKKENADEEKAPPFPMTNETPPESGSPAQAQKPTPDASGGPQLKPPGE
jgi:hypothetical protein